MTGNTDQFVELLKPCYSDALKYCRALCAGRSPDDAEDVLQNSLLKAMENLKSISDNSKFRSWFFKIITREFINFIRKDFWKKFLPLESGNVVYDIPEIYDREKQSDNKLLFEKALCELNIKERSSLLLFELGGFSLEEIKEIQKERSLSSVKSRLSRARAKLKNYIEAGDNSKGIVNKSLSKSNSNSENKGDLNHETIELISEIKNN